MTINTPRNLSELVCGTSIKGIIVGPEVDLSKVQSGQNIKLVGEGRSSKRIDEFMRGRLAAEQLLVELGLGETHVSQGIRGEPIWPTGITGSISHSRGYALAVAALKANFTSIGADLEYIPTTHRGDQWNLALLGRLANEKESQWLLDYPGDLYRKVRMLFSIKESIYKTFAPLAGQYFGFKDAEVLPSDEPRGSHFTGKILTQIGSVSVGTECQILVASPLRVEQSEQWVVSVATYVK